MLPSPLCEKWLWAGGTQSSEEGQEGDFRTCSCKGPQPVATFCAQEKSHIEVFKRPLSGEASALVFFSRRTDMPYHYHSSLSQLNYTGSKMYEVSTSAFPGGLCWGAARSPTASLSWELWGLWWVQLQALRAEAGAVFDTRVSRLCRRSWV